MPGRAGAEAVSYHKVNQARPGGRARVNGGERRLVGDTGFEPVTSAMSTQRSNQLS